MERGREQAAARADGDGAATWDAGADELVAAQYADRSQLRPVLDAVLAALPALGPATVQPRKTCVSLVTPRRVFAVVQPTAKSRVDLGLRLEHERPGGRLLAARDLGPATVRIPLTRPGDVDAEVIGWLRRAYAENAAPPPARHPAPVLGTLTVVIEASGLPGLTCPPDAAGEHHTVHIAVHQEQGAACAGRTGKPWLAAEPVPGDAPSARWEVPVTVRRDEAASTSAGRTCAATAPTATSFSPGATFPATARCG